MILNPAINPAIKLFVPSTARVIRVERALVHLEIEGDNAPIPDQSSGLTLATDGVWASVRQHSIQDLHADVRNKEIAFELRKIGAMMRGFYPRNDPTWSNEDKRRYWAAMETLLQRAHAIEQSKR